jgi:hypothetical protein
MGRTKKTMFGMRGSNMAAAPYIYAASAIFSAYSQYQGGQNAQEIARENQAALNQTALDNLIIARENQGIADAEANALLGRGAAAVTLKRKEISRLLAYQRVQEAISGFRYEGTPVEVAKISAEEGEQDVATIWSNALIDAETIRAKGRVTSLQGQRLATQQITQGDIVAKQGEYAASAGAYGGVSTLLSGVANAYGASQGHFTPYTYSR